MDNSSVYPVIPLRDIVVFPSIVAPLSVGRPKSLVAIDEGLKAGQKVLVLTQRDPKVIDPGEDDLYRVGTVVHLKQVSKLGDGNVKILIEGLERVHVNRFLSMEPSIRAEVSLLPSVTSSSEMEVALMRSAIRNFEVFLKASSRTADDFISILQSIEDPFKFICVLQAQLSPKLKDRQKLLEIQNNEIALELLIGMMMGEIEIIKLDKKIKNKVREKIEKNQRDYYLQEQLNAIHKELGDEQDPRAESLEFEKRLAEKKMPDYARARAKKEIKKFRATGGHAAEAVVARNYIELMLDLPWDEISEDRNDIAFSEKVLEDDHYGLKDVKERILDFLAVRAKVPHHKAPILCLSGPPGVGKTSLAKSIATSLNRKFERISLGGVRDEAELRGHRRTYIGSLPGKILTAIKNAGTSNPVILLDEIDKMGMDFRGDPASALLEILDPEQNKHFTDHYLDLAYDLSRVLFISTANTTDTLSAPLVDRMEIIRISGYNNLEKSQIAKRFLMKRELENHGLDLNLPLLDDKGFAILIEDYTKESGVRSLQKEISKVCRKFLRDQLKGYEPPTPLSPDLIRKYLGKPRFRAKNIADFNEIGVATGLAWTSMGGDTLTIETNIFKGRGRTQITGQLGKVMQESVKAALSYARSRANEFGLKEDYFSTHDFHIHLPEGGIPKDGPSAGITIASSIISAILEIPTNRKVAMTGEVTLRGRILPIGGLKEKCLAAQRLGIDKVLYPRANEADMEEILETTPMNLKLIPVSSMDEVLPHIIENYTSAIERCGRAAADFEIAAPKSSDLLKERSLGPLPPQPFSA